MTSVPFNFSGEELSYGYHEPLYVAKRFKQSKQDYRDEPKGMLFGLRFSSLIDNTVVEF